MVVCGAASRATWLACSALGLLAFGLGEAPARAEPPHRAVIGAPYQASGLWWVPAAQPNYEAVGAARAAVPALRTRESSELTAAHATLPLPSLVDVTNLDTGQTARLRLTERGATAPGRLLDLSPASARALGVQGEARVRVKLVSGAAARTYAAAPPLRSEETLPRSTAAFAVQAGAFGERERADRAALRLAAAGRAEVSATDRDGKRLWRVLLPAADATSAEASRARIAALGFADARVVRGI